MEASPVVQEAALNMWKIGEAEVSSYMDNLLSEQADVYRKMQKTKLKTFGTQPDNEREENKKRNNGNQIDQRSCKTCPVCPMSGY